MLLIIIGKWCPSLKPHPPEQSDGPKFRYVAHPPILVCWSQVVSVGMGCHFAGGNGAARLFGHIRSSRMSHMHPIMCPAIYIASHRRAVRGMRSSSFKIFTMYVPFLFFLKHSLILWNEFHCMCLHKFRVLAFF